MNRQKLVRILILVGIAAYVISPFDFIPDFFGFIGRIDDLLLILWFWWSLKAQKPERATHSASRPEPTQPEEKSRFDPYSTLEVTQGSTREEIEQSYRRLMTQYHPDKVAHLGAELRELAHQKTLQIQRAREALLSSNDR